MKTTELMLIQPTATVLLSHVLNSLTLERLCFQGQLITYVGSNKRNFCILGNKILANFILLKENNFGHYEGAVQELNVLQNLKQQRSGVFTLKLIADWITEMFAKVDTKNQSVIGTYFPEVTEIAVKYYMQIYQQRAGKISFVEINSKKYYIELSIFYFIQRYSVFVRELVCFLHYKGFTAVNEKYADRISVYTCTQKFLFNLLLTVFRFTDIRIKKDNNTGKRRTDNKGEAVKLTSLISDKKLNRLMRTCNMTAILDSGKVKPYFLLNNDFCWVKELCNHSKSKFSQHGTQYFDIHSGNNFLNRFNPLLINQKPLPS